MRSGGMNSSNKIVEISRTEYEILIAKSKKWDEFVKSRHNLNDGLGAEERKARARKAAHKRWENHYKST